MSRTAQPISLTDDDLRSLTALTRRGTAAARVQTRARILLLLHRGSTPDEVAAALAVGVATVFNVKGRYLSEGLDSALQDKPRAGKPFWRGADQNYRAGLFTGARGARPLDAAATGR